MKRNPLGPDELAKQCREMRKTIIKTIFDANMGHIGGDLSVIDILGTLYFKANIVWRKALQLFKVLPFPKARIVHQC